MGIFDIKKKRGRPRQNFTIKESEEILRSTLGRVKNMEIVWSSHQKINGNVFEINVKYISFQALELILKHRNVRDVYFNPYRSDHKKQLEFCLRIIYG